MTLKDCLNEFLFQKRLAGIGKNTIQNYNMTISFMVRAVGSDLPISELSFQMVTDYIFALYERPISKATMSSYIRNDRIFLRWAHTEYGLSFDPARIRVPKSPKKNVHIYNNEELRLIFSLIQTSEPWITARNRAIVALMLDSGLRQCEICELKRTNVDRYRRIIKITGKGSKDRMVPLGQFALALMDDYLAQCPFKTLPFVFANRWGRPLSGNAVRLFVYRLERKMPFKFSSHRLRHNFATNFCIDHVKETGKSDVYDLSILMGHESIETTKKYEHFAHEIIAAENSISHLDLCLGFGSENG